MNTFTPDVLEHALAEAHAALRAAGEPAGVWGRLSCTCGRPECEIRDGRTHTVALQLDALAAYLDPDAVPDALSEPLDLLADCFALWEGGDRPPADVLARLHAVRDRWLARMGTPLGGVPGEAWMAQLAEVEARNRVLVHTFLGQLAATPFSVLADAAARHARVRQTRLGREGVEACLRTLRAWMDDQGRLPERVLLQEHALVIIRESGWDAGEAQDFAQMVEDAAHALLAYGIAHDDFVRASYGAMEEAIPFASLRMTMVLADSPVPAGV